MRFADLVAAADRAAQIHLGGVTVLYQPANEAAVEVTGMFDAPHVLVDPGEGRGVEQTAPAVFLRLADLPVDPEDDEPILTIEGVDYEVSQRQRDGTGGIRLVLHRVD